MRLVPTERWRAGERDPEPPSQYGAVGGERPDRPAAGTVSSGYHGTRGGTPVVLGREGGGGACARERFRAGRTNARRGRGSRGEAGAAASAPGAEAAEVLTRPSAPLWSRIPGFSFATAVS